MAKKRVDEDDDFENDFENDDEQDVYEEVEEDTTESESEILVDDDDDSDLELVIEIDDSDLELEDPIEPEKEVDSESPDEIILSKHKIEGKHSLKYDSIFKGKKEDPVDEDTLEGFSTNFKETIEVDKSSAYHSESMDNEAYVRAKLVKERVYDILKENTSIFKPNLPY
jgi:hypothetical protein